MKALQYLEAGSAPRVVDIPDPVPGPGQVLLRVAAAGVCHSDLALMALPAERLPFPLPLTLGHEGVGTVTALGKGAGGVRIGDAVAVYGPWGCGQCPACLAGCENYCPMARRRGIHPPGLGSPGAIAEYMLVDDARHLVPIHSLDPVAAAPLTDAGLTPYHAIRRARRKLVPGATAVVIGTGGLGHIAIQLLRTLSPVRVIALDISEARLALALEVGAHDAVLSDEHAAARIRQLTGELGADAVFDFVGSPATSRSAVEMASVDSKVYSIGIGGGEVCVSMNRVPLGMSVTTPYWGSRTELVEVLALAQSGKLTIHTETYRLDDAPLVYERLRAGQITGRAVILPNS